MLEEQRVIWRHEDAVCPTPGMMHCTSSDDGGAMSRVIQTDHILKADAIYSNRQVFGVGVSGCILYCCTSSTGHI